MDETNSDRRERYHLNADGDFYVVKDMCIFCMMPEDQAPELMGFDEEVSHCYFKRQPGNPEELEHAIAAVSSSEVQGLRYAGNDEYVLRRLIEEGAAECCDWLPSSERQVRSRENDESKFPEKSLLKSCMNCLKRALGSNR